MSRKGSNIDDLCFLLINTSLSAVESLLTHGQTPDIAGRDGRTPLLQAVASGDVDRCDLLCRYGANVNHRDRQKRNSLHIAVLNKQEGMIHKLCQLSIYKNAVDSDGMTPLMISVVMGAPEITKLLLSYGCDVNTGSVHIDDLSALHLAIMKPESHSVVEDLLKAEADVNVGDSVGRTPLIYAIKAKSFTLMTLLLEYNANPNLSHPFSFAYELNFLEGVRLLLSYGAKTVQRRNESGLISFSKVNLMGVVPTRELEGVPHNFEVTECIIAEDGAMTSPRSGHFRMFKARDHRPSNNRLYYLLLAYGFDIGALCGKCFCLKEKCDRKVNELASKLSIVTPLPLTILSRNCIRLCLGRGVSRKAKQLNIPARFQNFLSEKVWDDSNWMPE